MFLLLTLWGRIITRSTSNISISVYINMCCSFNFANKTYEKINRKLYHNININDIILPPPGGGLYPPMIPSRLKSTWVACSSLAVIPGPPMRPSPFKSKPSFSSSFLVIWSIQKNEIDNKKIFYLGHQNLLIVVIYCMYVVNVFLCTE